MKWWPETRDNDLNLSVPAPTTSSIGSPLVDGTLCLEPRFRGPSLPIQPMVARSYVPIRLSSDVIALLNADLETTSSFFTGNGACRGEGVWNYSVMAVTAEGNRHMLSTGCLDEFFIDGTRAGFVPSAETTAMLRALVPPA